MPARSGSGKHGRGGFIVTSNGEQFVADVGRFTSSVDDLRPVLDGPVRFNIMNAMLRVFGESGRFTRGGRWARLSNRAWSRGGELIRPGYRDWKTGRFASMGKGSWWAYRGPRGVHFPKPLSLSGKLEGTLTSRVKGSVWRSVPHGFVFGTRARTSDGFDYARAHMLGTSKMPARPFLDWDMTGGGRQLWIKSIIKPVQRAIRHGLSSAIKHGYIDVDEVAFMESSGPLMERRGGQFGT